VLQIRGFDALIDAVKSRYVTSFVNTQVRHILTNLIGLHEISEIGTHHSLVL